MDVFISYEHQSKYIADNICAVLESKGIRCWYAPRDCYGDYATSIVQAIESCKVFVLILNGDSSNSPHVLNEVELAYKRILNGEITIVPFKVDEGILSKAMEYYVKRLHWIDAVSAPLEQAINQLYQQLVSILHLETASAADDVNTNRKNVTYYSSDDFIEIKRLATEEKLLYKYEKVYYDKLLTGRNGLHALDFGTLSPGGSIARLHRPEIEKTICFAYNADMVREGNDLCPDENIKFYHFNIKEDDLDEAMTLAMRDMGIKEFDFVNLTMVIMDLANPFKVLNKIKRYLAPNAMIYVRDIDDGVVFAYPDEKKLFEEFFSYYKYDSMCGSRHSARQIYSVMRKLGAREIKLERTGINSSGMSHSEKQMLFDSWFSFIPNDFKQISKKDPTNQIAADIVKWTDNYYDDLEEAFMSDEFIFNSGYICYTVKF